MFLRSYRTFCQTWGLPNTTSAILNITRESEETLQFDDTWSKTYKDSILREYFEN